MKNKYRYIFIIVFIMLPFLFINNVKADYEATALNPKGVKCELRSDSTGPCFYANSSFNSVTQGVLWLDNGDKVTVITSKAAISSKDTSKCPDKYVYTSYNSNKYGIKYGYYCNAYLKSSDVLTDALKNEFKAAGFPEGYWQDLALLKTAHPNWVFKAVDTGLDFKTAVNGENSLGRSLIQIAPGVNDEGYLNTWSGSYDYFTDTFKAFDSTTWFAANYDTIAYYMDPRNFLTDMHIFQFEGLKYNDKITEETYVNGVGNIFKNDYLSRFTNDFVTGGKESKVSPIYLASLSRQEVGNGTQTPNTAISGTYNGMYNFYNIGATSDSNPVYNGLRFAAQTDAASMRPWNTEYKAIVGGAKWMSNSYISIGQDTIYFKKWDVVSNINSASGSDFVHQYQTNIQAAASEARTTYSSYDSIGILDINYTFYIPVYRNMPDVTNLPAKGNPNNYLSSLTINGKPVAEFRGNVEEYNYYLDVNTPEIKLEATSVKGLGKIEGTGTFKITEDTTKTIKVTAKNGAVKNYKINIKITGTELEDPVDVKTTLNNSGIKNNDKYLSGFELGTDISYISKKIAGVNPDAKVELSKGSGKIATGDKVKITVNNETKIYEIVIYGDVNCDGVITASDYARVKNVFLGKSSLSGAAKEAADANKDANISASDYAKIKNNFLGKSTIIQ